MKFLDIDQLKLTYQITENNHLQVHGNLSPNTQIDSTHCFFTIYEKLKKFNSPKVWCQHSDCSSENCVIDIDHLEFSKTYILNVTAVDRALPVSIEIPRKFKI